MKTNKNLIKIYDKSPVFLQNCILTGVSAFLGRERYGGKYHSYREFLTKTQWDTKDELEAYQNEQLRKLIKHAYETVPYYQRIFKENRLQPSDIMTCADLPKLPVLTRRDIIEHSRELISTAIKPRQLIYGQTSGTTGSPLQVYYDRATINISYAALDRQYQWAGCNLSRFGDRIAVGRGNLIVPLSKKKPPFWRQNYLHNQLLLSSFHLSRKNLPHYFDKLERFQPKVLDGYPSVLYILAKFLKNNSMKFPLNAVITSSETLYDFQREVIEESFECKIFDYYTLAERVAFATECEKHEGHHLNSEYGITEIVDKDNLQLPNGKAGRLVGTSLHNFGMPMIRYVTNDMTAVKQDPCSCGRGLPLMEDVATKAEDIITLEDGRLIPPTVFEHPFKSLKSVEASQVIQKDYNSFYVKVIPNEAYNESDTEHIIHECKSRLGNNISVEVELVKELPRTKSGKQRFVISEVKSDI